MATTIVTKSGSGAPTASDLVAGELAVDLTNGRLYTEDSGGTVLELGLNPNGNVDVTGSVTASGTLSANNIRVGVALDAWGANSHVIQMGDGVSDNGALAWNTISGADYFDLMYQSYFDGTDYKYAAAAAVSRISQRNGAITFDRKAAGSADATFTWDNSLTIDTSGNVGIGTSSPSSFFSGASNLVVSGGSGNGGITIDAGTSSVSALHFADGTSGSETYRGYVSYDHSSDALLLGTSGTEAMRLSGGNLLVGQTSNDSADTGHIFNPIGVALHIRDGGVPLVAVRQTSDGELIQLKKDTAVVGSIGVANGDNLYIATDDTNDVGLKFNGDGNRITPCDASGADRGSAIDLGEAGGGLFKDLYLSGSANIGGNINNYVPTNSGNPEFSIGSSATNRLFVQSVYNSGAQVLNYTVFRTFTSSSTANAGRIVFAVDEADKLEINDGGIAVTGGVLAESPLLIGISSAAGVGGSASDTNSAEVGSGYINLNRDDTSSANQIQFGKNGSVVGRITTTTTTSYVETSDRRVKDNIADADDCGAEIDLMQVRKFDWRDGGVHHPYGMIAQELQQVAPIAVDAPENPEEMMGIDYSKLVPMLVKEIQSLRARIAALES